METFDAKKTLNFSLIAWNHTRPVYSDCTVWNRRTRFRKICLSKIAFHFHAKRFGLGLSHHRGKLDNNKKYEIGANWKWVYNKMFESFSQTASRVINPNHAMKWLRVCDFYEDPDFLLIFSRFHVCGSTFLFHQITKVFYPSVFIACEILLHCVELDVVVKNLD